MGIDANTEAAARARVDALQGALATREQSPVRLIETHISWVLLTAREAYKVKKPVRLPFLDFTALEDRRRCCEEELRLNRRLAPELYLGVVEVRDGPAGASLDGPGAVVDYAVRMQRFADGALWSERLAAGTLCAADVDAFARRLARFHRDVDAAPAGAGFGGAETQERVMSRLAAGVDAWQARLARPDPDWPGLRRWLDGERRRLVDHWPTRLASGRVRECHGDLHLDNIVQAGEEATAFDAIEFDPELRWIDVLDDLAFAVMDLLAHGRRDLAFRLLDGWLETSGDHAGLPALRYFLVGRALVRSQVAALREASAPAVPASACDAHAYLRLAVALAAGSDPRLLITHGLPGSGKTWLSQRLLESAGAVRVRSDVERKRLFGLSALASSRDGPGAVVYAAPATQATYERLRAAARAALDGGWPTIVDAAFLRQEERAAFADLARAASAPFSILDCRGSLPLLRQRIRSRQRRGDDASEADLAVLDRLAAVVEPLDARELGLAIVAEVGSGTSAAVLAERWLDAG